MILRRIDLHSPKTSAVALHGIHPFGGAPHFDFVLRYNKDVILASMPKDAKEAEAGENLLGLGKSHQDEFVKDYKFKTVGPKDEQEIRNYFLTTHWKKLLQYCTDKSVSHAHGYVEINFDPKILELIADEALAKIGWTVEKVVPCIFEVHGEYRAKICYMFGNPETVFDIGWVYNPDVVIKPVEEDWKIPVKQASMSGRRRTASRVLVSHAYIHIEEYDCPVIIGGVTVKPGDLLAADRHGVVLIPGEISNQLADACKKAADAEMPVLEGCRKAIAEGKKVDLEELRQWRAEMASLRTLK